MSETNYSFIPPETTFVNSNGLIEIVAPAMLVIDEAVIDLLAKKGNWDKQIADLKAQGYLAGNIEAPDIT